MRKFKGLLCSLLALFAVVGMASGAADKLSLTLPITTSEGAGTLSGSIELANPVEADLSVTLVSDNPSAVRGEIVTITAGQRSAAFSLDVLDNNQLAGVRSAIITASAEDVTSGRAAVFVFDDETASLLLTCPADFTEGQGVLTNAATVWLGGEAAYDMAILLVSSDESELKLPPSVTIPKGARSVSFDIEVMDDSETDGRQSLYLEAKHPGFAAAKTDVTVADDDASRFTLEFPSGAMPAKAPILASAKAWNVDGEFISSYAGAASFSAVSGATAVLADPVGPVAFSNGVWAGAVTFDRAADDIALTLSDGQGHEGSVSTSTFALNVVKMATDWTLPYIYMAHKDTVAPNASKLIWYNTTDGGIERVAAAGENVTDLTVSYADDKIYVSNWRRAETRAFDRSSKAELESLALGTDVYAINAAGPGRVLTEEEDQWIYVRMRDTETGAELTRTHEREGDGETTLDGRFYYRSDNNISNARLYKLALTNDVFESVTSARTKSYYGSRNVIVSMDGTRVYNCGAIYNADLKELLNLGSEIYAASAYGDLALTAIKAFNGVSGEELALLPFATTIMAFSGDQSELVLFNPADGSITALDTAEILPLPAPRMVPTPTSGSLQSASLSRLSWTAAPVAVGYDVYLGTNSSAVASASTNSVEYLGRVTPTEIELARNALVGDARHFWRVDKVTFGGEVETGELWAFDTAAIAVNPYDIVVNGVTASYTQQVSVAVSDAVADPVDWTVTCTNDWVLLGAAGGTGAATLDIGVDLTGLAPGAYSAELLFSDGEGAFSVPLELSVEKTRLVKMVADWSLPYVYMAHVSEEVPSKSLLIWYNTDTDSIEHVTAAGENVTDIAVHYADDKIYASNHGRAETQVFDRGPKTRLEPLALGTDVYHIEAGAKGRLYTAKKDWIAYLYAFDSTNEVKLATSGVVYPGDSATTLDGRYLYYGESYSSGDTILKFDVSGDTFAVAKEVRVAGSRVMVLSKDGQRVFTNKRVYDADLVELGAFDSDVLAASAFGELAITSTTALNARNGEELFELPFTSSVMALSGDQSELLMFDATSGSITSIATSVLMPTPDVELTPYPEHGGSRGANLPELAWSDAPSAVGYDVYLGADASAIAAATTNSPRYLGRLTATEIALARNTLAGGTTYSWRVDMVAFDGSIVKGETWNFDTASVAIDPYVIEVDGLSAAYSERVTIAVTNTVATPVDWTVTCSNDWVSLGAAGGTGSESLDIDVDMTGLAPGAYSAELLFNDGAKTIAVPLNLSVEKTRLVKMTADWSLPYVYMAHTSETAPRASRLIWYNTDTDSIERVVDAGENITDLAVHYADNKLYLSSSARTEVFDRDTKTRLEPLALEGDIYRVAAGVEGRLHAARRHTAYTIILSTYDSTNSAQLANSSYLELGDAESTLNGRYLYYCENGSSSDALWKYDVSGDALQIVKQVPITGSSYLVLSMDGQRVFTNKKMFDADLNEARDFGADVHAASAFGDLAVTSTKAFSADTGEELYSLPFSSSVMALSGDQSELLLYDAASGSITSIATSAIMPLPSLEMRPTPADESVQGANLMALSWTASPSAIGYDVYFGSDSNAVATATTNDAAYLGHAGDTSIALPADALSGGATYYWRVDVAAFGNQTLPGVPWSFSVADIYLEPGEITIAGVAADYTQRVAVAIGAAESAADWTARAADDWISLAATNGSAPTTLQIDVDLSKLDAGIHESTIEFLSGGDTLLLPVSISVQDLRVVNMITDWTLPYVYMASVSEGAPNESRLIWYNTELERIEHVARAGRNVTDLTVHYGEDRVYLSNDGHAETRVFDRTSKMELPPLELGAVSRLSAGRAGRLFGEQSGTTKLFDTAAASLLVSKRGSGSRTGDGDCSLDGRDYYHCDSGSTGSRLYRFDVSSDTFATVTSVRPTHPSYYYGSDRMFVSGDGSRVFSCGTAYRAKDLREISRFEGDLYAASFDGRFVVTADELREVDSNTPALDLPCSGAISAFAGGLKKLVLFNDEDGKIVVQNLDAVDGFEASGLAPAIADGASAPLNQSELSWSAEPLAIRYEAYFGTDAAAVSGATTNSAEYLGTTEGLSVALPEGLVAGTTYYWRVDALGVNGLLTSETWSFVVAPIGFEPAEINMALFNIDGLTRQALAVKMDAASSAWSIVAKPSWVTVDATSGTGDSSIVLDVNKAALSMGDNTGTLTFASGGERYDVPILARRLNEMVTCFASSDQGKIYAASYEAGEDQSYLLEIGVDPFVAERVLELPANITDMDLDPAGTNLYAISLREGDVSKVDLGAFKLVATKELPSVVRDYRATDLNLAVGADEVVYYLDGQWSPKAHAFDFAGGTNLFTYNPSNSGFGGLAYGAERDRLYSWDQYGWTAGNANSTIRAFELSDTAMVSVDASTSQARDPLDSPLLLVDGEASVINKKRRLNAEDLKEVEASFAQNIYAAMSSGALAIGSSKVYRGSDGTELATLPYASNARHVLEDGVAMVSYNSATKRMDLTSLSQWLDPLAEVEGRVPERGASVAFTLEEFSWTTQEGARRFNVYLGADSNAVAAATIDSPEFLGSVSKPRIELPANALAARDTYYWRVDAVAYDATVVKSAVYEFEVSAVSIASDRVDLQTLDAGHTARFAIDLTTRPGGPTAWTVVSPVDWMSPVEGSGSGDASVEIAVNVSALNEGTYTERLVVKDAQGREVEIPVVIEVLPLNITKMEADLNEPLVYALNVTSTATNRSHLLVINTNTEQVERVLEVVDDARDFAVHYGDDRVYVSAFGNAAVSVIDKSDWSRLADLTLNTHVYRISSGPAGTLVAEDDGTGNAYYGRVRMWDSTTGTLKYTSAAYTTGRGTGESDAAGTTYYRGDSTRYPYAGYLRKYTVSGSALSQVATLPASKSARRELIVSADGSKVFWMGSAYDASLSLVVDLGSEVYAASSDGSMAATEEMVLNAETAEEIASLPVASSAMAFVDDGSKLAFFNPTSKAVEWLTFEALAAIIVLEADELSDVSVVAGETLARSMTISNAGNGNLSFSISSGGGASVSAEEGLIARYPFNGAAADESGNGHDGVVNGATLTTDRFGNADSAYAFDGVNDYIRIGAEPNVPALDAYTISVWFLNDGGGNQNGNYGQKILDRTSWYHDFYLAVSKNGAPRFQLYESSALAMQDGSRDYRDSEWHHMVVTRDGSNAQLWVDGEPIGASTVAFAVNSSSDLLIGYSESGDSLQRVFWSGKIDDLEIHDRALSGSDIAALYAESEVGAGSWMSVSPASGTVPPGTNLVVNVDFSAEGMAAGSVSNATLTVTCNDALSPEVQLPVAMAVIAAPVATALPATWAETYFGAAASGAVALPGADADGDGQSNLEEYIAGADPTDAASRFAVQPIATEAGFRLEWESVVGRVYTVQWKPDLMGAFQTLESGIRHPRNSYVDEARRDESSGFYRVVVEKED